MQKKRVLLFGKSVILGTIGASLKHYPDLEIIPISQGLPDAPALRDLAPNVILYDIRANQPELALLLSQPDLGLLLIGIDPDSNQVLVWSGRQIRELSTNDLVAVIDESLSSTPT